VLIFAPHPDDETLGAGGLIQKAVVQGARVKVVFLTCGDAFRYAAQRRLGVLKTTPSNMRAFGRLRQKEALAALSVLGVSPEAAVFLGFPDRGLAALWQDHWSPANPYRSPYTDVNASPYDTGPAFANVYSGQTLLASVEDIIRSENPTVLVFPSPHEGHPDHWAASAFVSFVLEKLKDDRSWHGRPRVYTYLVHYNNWPRPWGADLARHLEPPPPIAGEGLWLRLDLSLAERAKKMSAILKYSSQVAVMRGFLTSFARASELYWACPAAEVLSTGVDLAGRRTLAVDPVGDSMIERLKRDADIVQLDGALDGQDLKLWLRLRGTVKKELSYRLEVVALARTEPIRRRVELRYPEGDSQAGTAGQANGDAVVFTIPRTLLGDAAQVFIAAETYQGKVRADRLPQVRVVLE
jgi:LmbE family N-acetylglucosaminyl deacetylase